LDYKAISFKSFSWEANYSYQFVISLINPVVAGLEIAVSYHVAFFISIAF
jgi:hypothetical protein